VNILQHLLSDRSSGANIKLLKLTDSILFKYNEKSSPVNYTVCLLDLDVQS